MQLKVDEKEMIRNPTLPKTPIEFAPLMHLQREVIEQ